MLEQLWGSLFGPGGGRRGDERREEADPDAATHPLHPSKKIFFQSQRRGHPSSKKGGGESVDEESRKKSPAGETPMCRRRCLFSSPSPREKRG